MSSQLDLDRQIAKKLVEVRELEERKQQFDKLTEEQKLATLLHEKLCHASHVDQCGWGYESWERDAKDKYSARGRFLLKAQRVLNEVNYETAVTVVRAMFKESQ